MSPEEIYNHNKFVAKGFKLGIINSLKLIISGSKFCLYPEHDYLRWSANIKVGYRGPAARGSSLYISENLRFLNIYEVSESLTEKKIGTIRYHFGIWELADEGKNYFSIVPAESVLDEIFFLKHVTYNIADASGRVVGQIKKVSPFFSPCFYKYLIAFSADSRSVFDRRLGLAALMLFIFAQEKIVSIEGLKRYLRARIFKPKQQ